MSVTPRSRAFAVACLAAVTVAAACEHSKSSNPLSPTIAGPIPGVQITEPVLLEPGQGWKFRDREQPLTLLVENASTNGVRPLVYAFEIATDSGFSNVVFSRRDVPQGDNGRTALRLSDRLQLGRTYYWRAWAYDGANTGSIAASISFDIFPPAILNVPQAITPVGNAEVSSTQPPLIVRNSPRSGPVGSVKYRFEISTNQAFSHLVAATGGSLQPEGPSGETAWVPGRALTSGENYYWRAMATDGEVSSGWSATQGFVVRIVTAPSPSPLPPGGSCSSLAADPYRVVECRRRQYGSRVSAAEAPGLLRAIAGDLNTGTSSSFYGVLRKTSGNNCGGLACDIVCARNGSNHWDVMIDGPDAGAGYAGIAAPSWGAIGPVDPARCIAP